MEVIYRLDPPHEVWLQLLRSMYASDLWSLAEDDLSIWKQAFGKRFSMIVAYDEVSFFPVGCVCSATFLHYNRVDRSTIIGLFYVMKECRGRGIGNELFRRIISDKSSHNLYLNGVSYMIEKYRIHYNFNKSTPWRILLYQMSTLDIDVLDLSRSCSTSSSGVVSISPRLLEKTVAYDSSIQGDIDRTSFIRLFLVQKTADTKIALDNNGAVIGMATARLLDHGELFIGPLYADNDDTANSLLFHLLTGVHKDCYQNVQLQIPSNNAKCRETIERICHGKCTVEDYTIGLSTKFQPLTDVNKVYSTTEYDLSFA